MYNLGEQLTILSIDDDTGRCEKYVGQSGKIVAFNNPKMPYHDYELEMEDGKRLGLMENEVVPTSIKVL